MPGILIVDDDMMLISMLQQFLDGEGFATYSAHDLGAARHHLKHSPIDLVLLDLTLRGEDGLALARELAASPRPAVIIVSGKGDAVDRIVGLEVGADDYVSKPFSLRELLARVRAVLRRLEAAPAKTIAPTTQRLGFGLWVLNCAKHVVEDGDGQSCALTTAEYKLLHALVSHPHQVLSRDQLMDKVAGRNWTPYDRAIDTQMRRLRQKLSDFGIDSSLIQTVRGTGYMFTADVQGL
jgi:two-component system, OmpR family, response regulator